jgi:hypothetical protein
VCGVRKGRPRVVKCAEEKKRESVCFYFRINIKLFLKFINKPIGQYWNIYVTRVFSYMDGFFFKKIKYLYLSFLMR